MILGRHLHRNIFNPIFWLIFLISTSNLAVADPYPPKWDNSTHYQPVAWPTEPNSPLDCGKSCGEWLPYTRFQNEMADARIKDPSNGGTSPQSYVNVASSCIDKSLPSIYYSLHQGASEADDVLMFRWRVESAAHTYATGPNTGKYGSSHPWSSALWTVFFDIDGSGYRSLAAHLDGSIGSPASPIDRMVGIWGSNNNNSLDYVNDSNIIELGHNSTAFAGDNNKLLNFQNSLNATEDWPNGSAETVWDYGTSRATSVSKNSCTEYFIDYQIPVAMLDASAHGGPKITRDTPISMMFCTANSLNNPLQKDCAIGKEWLANPQSPAPFGDYLSFNQTTPYSQPIISAIEVTPPASCPGTYQLEARVQDTLALNNGDVVASVQAVDFYYWHDVNGDGAATADDGGSQWIKIANTAALSANSLNTWQANWDAQTLFKGKYLIGAQALDDNSVVDDDMPVSGINNRTFSYLSGNTDNQIYIDDAWLSGEQANFPSHSPLQSPSSTENWYGNPSVTGQQIALVGTAINACGIAPTISLTADVADVAAAGAVNYQITVTNHANNSDVITLSQIDNVLPQGFSYQTSSTTDVTTDEPQINAQELTWFFASPLSINPGDNVVLSFTATATSLSGTYNDVASAVTSFDTLTSSPLAIAVDSVRLSLSNSPSSISVAADNNDEITFTLSYSNDSSVLVTNPTISTTIEANSNYVSCTGGLSCDLVGSTLTWTLADITGGASGNVSYALTVDNTWSSSKLTSSAVLNVIAPDSGISSVTATASVAVTGIAITGTPSLSLSNTSDVITVAPGGDVIYTLSYTNDGTAEAESVILTDIIPEGMVFASCSDSCTESNGTVTWPTIASVAEGTTTSVTLTLTVPAANDPFSYPNPSTNTALIDWTDGTQIVANAEVGVSGQYCEGVFYFKEGSYSSGGNTIYATSSIVPTGVGTSLTVTGITDSTLDTYDIETDQIIFETAGVAGSLNISSTTFRVDYYLSAAQGGMTTRVIVRNETQNTVIATTAEVNVSNKAGFVTFEGTVPAATTINAGDQLRWYFQFGDNSGKKDVTFHYDGVTENSRSSFCSATAPANLIINTSVNDTNINAGDTSLLTYTTTYSNTGAADATTPSLVQNLPTNFTNCQSSIDKSTWNSCSASLSHTFSLATITADTSGTVYLRGNAPVGSSSGDILTSTATIVSDQTSLISDTATTEIASVGGNGGVADLILELDSDKTLINPTDEVEYRLKITNIGGAAATNVVISNSLPVEDYYIYNLDCSNSCSQNVNDLTWNIASLAANTTQTFIYKMTAGTTNLTAGISTMNNSATVTADALSAFTSNEIIVSLSGNPQLALTHTATPNTSLAPNGQVTYQITITNEGNSTAKSVTLVDNIPENMAYAGNVTSSVGSGRFDAINNQIKVLVGDLAAGASTTIIFDANFNALLVHGDTTTINTATVTASNHHAVSASVSATASATAVLSITHSQSGASAYPAAQLTANASNSSIIYLDNTTVFTLGQLIEISSQYVTITNITKQSLSVNQNITANTGDNVISSTLFSINYQNTGNATATNVVLSELLPTSFTYYSASPNSNSAPAVGDTGTISWNVGELKANSSGLVKVSAFTNGTTGNFTATASIDSDETILLNANVDTAIGGISVNKSTSTSLLSAGSMASYQITLSNTLNSDVNNIDVTDLLSNGFSYSANSARINTIAIEPTFEANDEFNNQPTWSSLSVAANASTIITFDAEISNDTSTGSYHNEVNVVVPTGTGLQSFDHLATKVEDVLVIGDGYGVVNGYVFERVNGIGDNYVSGNDTPLAGVQVNIYPEGADCSGAYAANCFITYTDANGYFSQVVATDTWIVEVDSDSGDLEGKGWNLTIGANKDVVTVPNGAFVSDDNGYQNLDMYTVSASAGTGGSISPSSRSVISGSTTSFSVTADSGYSIESVVGDGGCSGSLSNTTYTTGTITADCSVTATFSLDDVTAPTVIISGAPTSVSTTDAFNISIDFSENVTGFVMSEINLVNASASNFVANVDGKSYTADITPSGAGTISISVSSGVAKDASNNDNSVSNTQSTIFLATYTVSASAGTGGSISPSTRSVISGNTTSFTVTADSGYSIESVVGDGGCSGSLSNTTYTTGAINADCSVTATFDDLISPTTPTVVSQTTNNTQPTITGTFDSSDAAGGFTVTIDASIYSLGTDNALSASGDSWSLDLAAAGKTLVEQVYSVIAIAYDTAGNSAIDTTQNEVSIVINDAPQIDSTAPTSATLNALYSYPVTVIDPDDSNNGVDLSWGLSGQPQGMSISDLGVVTWTPATGVVTSGEVTLTVADGGEDNAQAAVEIFTITVSAEHNHPVADVFSLNEGEELSLSSIQSVLNNDTGLDDSYQVELVESVSHGSLSLNTDGALVYKHDGSETLTDSFTYRVTKGDFSSQTATVTFNITPINDQPIADNDTVTIKEDNQTVIDILANDIDNDGTLNPASIVITSHPVEGSVIVNTNSGTVTYTPKTNFYGEDNFSYQVSDNDNLASASAKVAIIIQPQNDAPKALNDVATMQVNSKVHLDALANDSDIDGDELALASFTFIERAQFGASSFADGKLVYQPNTDYVGSDTIVYTINDIHGGISNTATIYLNISDDNNAPVALDDVVSVDEDETLVIENLANDTDSDGTIDSSSIVIIRPASLGDITVDSLSGNISYQPHVNINGVDAFSYIVKDNNGNFSNEANVEITINAVNDAPIANNDHVVSQNDQPLIIKVLANDSDVEGELTPASLIIEIAPSYGTLTIDLSIGNVTYTPGGNFAGNDSFQYSIADVQGLRAQALVTISTENINEAPVANDDLFTVTEDSQDNAITVLTNDYDPEQGLLTVLSVSALHGEVLIESNGQLSYSPIGNYSGIDVIDYQISDSDGLTATAKVLITVTPTADNANILGNTVREINEESEAITELLSVIDLDKGENVFISQTDISGQYGTFMLTEQGQWTYSLNKVLDIVQSLAAGESLTDSFSVSSIDGTATENITITIIGLNDSANIGGNLTGETSEDQSEQLEGKLSITDIDNNEQTFTPLDNNTLDYGDFSITETGDWHYVIDKSNTQVQALKPGDVLIEVITITSKDGTESTITITIHGSNDTPVLKQLIAVVVAEDSSETNIEVTTHIFDADNDELTISTASSELGDIVINSDGSIGYTPVANYFGEDKITLSITDGTVTIIETVRVTVTPVNDAPVAINDIAVTYQNDTVIISVLDNDSDIDSPELFTLSTDITTSQGNIIINDDNALVFTPAVDVEGQFIFSYTINDGEAEASAQVEVIVTADPAKVVNKAPIANTDDITATDWSEVIIDVLANDTDAENDSLTIISASADLGEVSFIDGKLVYHPVLGQINYSVLEYSIVDTAGNIDHATVTVNFDIADVALLPQIEVPADLCNDFTLNADALYTRVELGMASASDRFGNAIPVSLLDGTLLFPPGLNTVYWQATDAEGRTAIAAQNVCIKPLISLKKDQVVLEGETVNVGIYFNGESPEYPVVVPFTVTGDAGLVDHNAVSGEVLIESGTDAVISFSTWVDDKIDGDETIIITLTDTINRGAKFEHIITIKEDNLAPEIELNVSQANEQRMFITTDGGEVIVNADVYDANQGDTFIFDWLSEGAEFSNLSEQSNQFIFNPEAIMVGTYHIKLIVTDSATDAMADTASIYIQVVEALETLTNQDSDGDNIPDNLEGYADQDGDGIPDYLDRIDECNVLTEVSSVQDGYLIEGNPGVCLRRGNYTLTGETGGAHITDNDVSNEYIDMPADDAAINIGGIFDFIAYGLPENAQKISITLPQRKPIPENGVYRKLTSAGNWVTFTENEDNRLWSTQGEPGYCPPPNSAKWQSGLTAGHWCVQLEITDGDINDDDGELNGTVIDPGYVGVLVSGNHLPVAVDEVITITINTSNIEVDALNNDTDEDGDNLTITSATSSMGNVEVIDGVIVYRPILNYSGTIIIEYGISDSNGGSDSGQVTIFIEANQAPIPASSIQLEVKQALIAEPINLVELASDKEGDNISLESASALHGVVSINSNGDLVYTPDPEYAGEDVITYTIRDEYGNISQGEINVSVEPYEEITATTKSGGSLDWLLISCLFILVALRQNKLAKRQFSIVLSALLLMASFSSVQASEQLKEISCTAYSVNADCPAYSKWFIGGQLGYSNSDVSASEINQAFKDVGAIASSLSVDDSAMAYELFAGYQFNPMWALQLGYLDLGSRGVEFQGQTSDPDAFFDAVEHIYPDSGEGLKLSVIGSFPINERWKVSGRLSLFNWSQEYNTNSATGAGNDKISGTDILLGGEVSYAIRRDVQLYLSYDRFKVEHHDADNFGFGIRYFFGEDKLLPKPAPIVKVKSEPKPALVIVAAAPVIIPKPVLPANMSIYYPLDQFSLDEANLTKLLKIKTILDARDDLEISIHGYASAIGDEQRNRRLSIWRAHGVEKQLYLGDITLSRMEVEFHGDIDQPADPKGQRVDIEFKWSDDHESSEIRREEIKFGIFSERITATDLAQVQAAIDAQDLTQLHHVELISFAKPPGDKEGLIELAAKRAKKLAELLKVRGVNVPILLDYVFLEPKEEQTDRKVVIKFFIKQ